MQLQDDIRSLAEQIASRHADERRYTLVLGTGIAAAAGLPPFEELVAAAGLSAADGADRRIVERLLWDRTVPPFMYDAAGLVRDRSFPRVITTGYDNLLERALVDAGLRNGNHFAVTDVAAPDAAAVPPPASARIRIVRLHGAGGVRPHTMDRALGTRFQERRNVLVLVGYQFESPALERWLAALDGCELWWVGDGGDGAASRIGWRGEWHTVMGEATTPETFFGQLALLLVHLPTAGGAYPEDPATSPGDEELDALYLQGRLEQANVVRRSIEQRITSGGADPAATRQLRAQDDEISRLGQSYAPAAEPPANPAQELLGRFEALRGSLEPLVGDASAPVDADTLAFVDGQIDALRREATKPEPSSLIVVAAGAAMDGLMKTVAPYVDAQAS